MNEISHPINELLASDCTGGNLSSILREVQVPIVSEESCRNAYVQSAAKIDKTYLCAGFAEGGKDACRVIICS
jgi:Trypsin